MASRQLKIKTGVVSRLVKEEASYRKEVESQKAVVEKYVAEGKDEWDIKNARKVLVDTERMVPDTQQRLSNAFQELTQLTDAHSEELAGTEELSKAKEVLKLAKAANVV